MPKLCRYWIYSEKKGGSLKTDCSTCIHKDICRYKDNAKYDMNKLRDMNYGEGSNDDYDWETMSNSHHVNIDFSCKDYRNGQTAI